MPPANTAALTDIEGVINNVIEPLVSEKKLFNFYQDNFPLILTTDVNYYWYQSSSGTNISTGGLQDANNKKIAVGTFTQSVLKYLEPQAQCKFVAPIGYHFMPDGTLMQGSANHPGATDFLWTTVIRVIDSGTVIQADGTGPIVFNDIVPTGAILTQIIAKFSKVLSSDIKLQMLDKIFSNSVFGLRYNTAVRDWVVIDETNLNLFGSFSTGKTGDNTNQQLDASWLLLFTTDTDLYTVTYRGVRYVFESDKEIRFFYDSNNKDYVANVGKVIKDKISVLSINNAPGILTPMQSHVDWQVLQEYRDTQGYVDSKKIEVTQFDSDDDGLMDNPDAFKNIVANNNYIFQKKITTAGVEDFNYVSTDLENIVTITSENQIGAYSSYDTDTVFYNSVTNVFKKLSKDTLTIAVTGNYKAHLGRSQLKFQYVHSADSATRIDPSVTNIIDVFLLTRSYDIAFRSWLDGTIENKPLPLSSDSMFKNFGQQINLIKSISDEVIYHPVKYKVLFGDKSESKFQATFKLVKNLNEVTNNDDIKVRVIQAINQYFNLENWDFGDTFYFSELSTYVMTQLAPDIVTFVIVPDQAVQTFGSLYEIKSESDEIFISGATVQDVEIIDALTASKLRADGFVVTATNTINTGITSGTSSVATSSNSSGGSGSSGSSGSSGGYGY